MRAAGFAMNVRFHSAYSIEGTIAVSVVASSVQNALKTQSHPLLSIRASLIKQLKFELVTSALNSNKKMRTDLMCH